MQLLYRRTALAVAVLVVSGSGIAQAQSTMSGYQTPAEQELYNTSPGQPKGTVLDATNPMDLINRLRQATAMDDATDPVDAIDAALKGWDAQTTEPGQAALVRIEPLPLDWCAAPSWPRGCQWPVCPHWP